MALDKLNSDMVTDGTIVDADVSGIASSKLSGTIADARFPATLPVASGTNLTSLPAANLTGVLPVISGANLTGITTDVTSIRQDIVTLALHSAITDNKAAHNLPFAFIDQFEDDSGILTETTVDRDSSGEYVSSVGQSGSAFSDDANTKLLMHMDDASLNTDSSGTVSSGNITVTGCVRSTTQSIFGGYSAFFDGSNDYIAVAMGSDGVFGTGDFTVECWCWWDSATSSNYQGVIGKWHGSPNQWDLRPNSEDASGNFSAHDATSIRNSTQAPADDTWQHLAWTRLSGTSRLWYNGVEKISWSHTTNYTATDDVHIGVTSGPGSHHFGGYLDEVRISNSCRYTSNFTPAGTATFNATGTLISNVQTAPAATTSLSGVILYTDTSGTATLGTDLKIYMSANNGTNFTEASSYATAQTFSGSVKVVRLGKTTVTSGTQVKLKAVWANQVSGSKETRLNGWAINY